MTAGTSLTARVIVENSTGHAILVPGCLAPFQVVLVSDDYRPIVAWPGCLQMFTIPAGQSSYPATVRASYRQCGRGRPQGAVRACLPDGQPPPLPPGDYRATLFQASHIVPIPMAMTVRVTQQEPAP